MKTAMRELMGKLRQLAFSDSHHLGLGDIRITQGMIDEYEKEFVEKERQQILDSYFNGKVDRQPDNFIGKERTGEQYYNETYGKDDI